jgi:hypothetical protein
MKKIFLLPLCGVIFSFLFLSSGNSTAFAEAEIKKWTVEETVEKVREAGFHEVLYNYGDLFLETRLNPDARPDLYRILNDKTKTMPWDNVFAYFALVGQEEDVPKLLYLVEKCKGTTVDSDTEWMFSHVIDIMSRLELRGIKSAGSVMDKMITPEYWQQLDIKVAYSATDVRSATVECAALAAYDKCHSGDPKAQEKVRAICDKIQSPDVKKTYAFHVETAVSEYDDFMEAKKSGDWKAFYEKRQRAREAADQASVAKSTPAVGKPEDKHSSGLAWFWLLGGAFVCVLAGGGIWYIKRRR